MPSLPAIIRENGTFRLFLVAASTSMLGSAVFDLALPLYILQKTHSEFWLAQAALSIQLPYVIMAPIVGYLVDHFNKRTLMIWTDVLQVFSLGWMLLCVFYFPDAIWPLLLLSFTVKSLMIVFETISNFQIVPCLVSKRGLSNANTWFLCSQRAIQIVGPIIGGVLVQVTGFGGCILFNALTFAATLYFSGKTTNLNHLIEDKFGVNKPSGGILTELPRNFAESLRAIASSRLLRPFVFLMFFWNLCSLVPNAPSVTYLLTEQHQLTPVEYGFAISLVGLSGVIGYFMSPLFRRAAFVSRILYRAALWQAVLGTFCVLFTGYPLLFIAMFALYRLPSSSLTVATFFLRQTKIPPKQMGSINSSLRMLFMIGAPTSCLLQAHLIHTSGVVSALCFGVLCLWSTAYFSKGVSRAYEQPDPVATPEPVATLEVDRAA